MHVLYDPDKEDWSSYFSRQGGSGYYEGLPLQRGYGIGSIFGSLFRFLLPIAKSVGKEIGREGISLGSRLLGDIAQGQNVKESLVRESKDSLKTLVKKANDRLQTGQGKRRIVGRAVIMHKRRKPRPKDSLDF